jgi:hypothetical protein
MDLSVIYAVLRTHAYTTMCCCPITRLLLRPHDLSSLCDHQFVLQLVDNNCADLARSPARQPAGLGAACPTVKRSYSFNVSVCTRKTHTGSSSNVSRPPLQPQLHKQLTFTVCSTYKRKKKSLSRPSSYCFAFGCLARPGRAMPSPYLRNLPPCTAIHLPFSSYFVFKCFLTVHPCRLGRYVWPSAACSMHCGMM